MDLDAIRRCHVDRHDLLGLLWHLHVVANSCDPRLWHRPDGDFPRRGWLSGVRVVSMADANGMTELTTVELPRELPRPHNGLYEDLFRFCVITRHTINQSQILSFNELAAQSRPRAHRGGVRNAGMYRQAIPFLMTET